MGWDSNPQERALLRSCRPGANPPTRPNLSAAPLVGPPDAGDFFPLPLPPPSVADVDQFEGRASLPHSTKSRSRASGGLEPSHNSASTSCRHRQSLVNITRNSHGNAVVAWARSHGGFGAFTGGNKEENGRRSVSSGIFAAADREPQRSLHELVVPSRYCCCCCCCWGRCVKGGWADMAQAF